MSSFIRNKTPTVGSRIRGASHTMPLHQDALILPGSVARNMTCLLENLQNMKITRDNNRSTTLSGRTAAVEEIVEIESSKRPLFDVVLVLDVSGSMSGKPSREMLKAVHEVVGILEEVDGLSIIKFSNDTETLMPLTLMRNMKVADKLTAHLDGDGFRCGGGTKLWDSMAVGLEVLAKRPRGSKHPTPSHPHLVVITDGEDVCSTAQSVESITRALHQPGEFAKSLEKPGQTFANFHCSLISVGRPEDVHVQRFASMANRPNLHHYTANSAADISSCFRKVQEKIVMIRRKHNVVSMEMRTVETLQPVTVRGRGVSRGRGSRGPGRS